MYPNGGTGPREIQDVLPKSLIDRDASLDLKTNRRNIFCLQLRKPESIDGEAGMIALLAERVISESVGSLVEQIAQLAFFVPR